MTEATATTRRIQSTGAPQAPLAVGDRRHREKRPPPPPRAKPDRPATDPDEQREDQAGPGRAIDIRI